MSISVVVGGQFGSEGKGKTTSLLARDYGDKCVVVRGGGPNSGHIVHEYGREFRFRHLPAGLVYGRPGYLAPAAIIDLEVLRQEVSEYEIGPDLLSVDPFSVVVTKAHRTEEEELGRRISSTGSGTGAATAAKVMRRPDLRLVKDVMNSYPWIEPYVRDVRSELNALADRGVRIILEGTQGFGLSLHHSRHFPCTTSKDTSAAEFVMEAGLSPLLVDEIVMAVRTFPIRVSGEQAGELPNEITWDKLRTESGYPTELSEFTTVTRKLRRVGRFDLSLVLEACRVNRPTKLAVHGLDYLGYENYGLTEFESLNSKAKEFLTMLEAQTDIPILYAFTGKENSAVARINENKINPRPLQSGALKTKSLSLHLDEE
jgi:adenylosuccinate synthase